MRLCKWHICITKNEIVYCESYAKMKGEKIMNNVK